MPDRQLGREDWYANIEKAHPRNRLGSRGPPSATASGAPPSGTARCPTRTKYAPVLQAVRPGHQAQRHARSSPATRTARRSPSCTSGSRRPSTSSASSTRSSSSTTTAPTTARRSSAPSRGTTAACSASRIRAISARRRPSAAAWRSPRKNACVLLDGDLQDPPELIEQFVAKWREGYDVVYGRRVKREARLFMQFAYKVFYRVFDYFSYIRIPHDAGDFSLMDRRVVQAMLAVSRARPVPPRRARLRRLQADRRRLRPARADVRRTTNSLLKNIGWAKKGILSFSNTPLNMLRFAGVALLAASSCLWRCCRSSSGCSSPAPAPPGFTTVLVLILFFGSLQLLRRSASSASISPRSSRRSSNARISSGGARSATARSARRRMSNSPAIGASAPAAPPSAANRSRTEEQSLRTWSSSRSPRSPSAGATGAFLHAGCNVTIPAV